MRRNSLRDTATLGADYEQQRSIRAARSIGLVPTSDVTSGFGGPLCEKRQRQTTTTTTSSSIQGESDAREEPSVHRRLELAPSLISILYQNLI